MVECIARRTRTKMLIINTEVKPSEIHGTGLFTTETLYEGQIIWVMHKSFDVAFTKQDWDLLPDPAKNYLRTYMYWSERLHLYVGCLDNSRHMNHSKVPNTVSIYFNHFEDIPPAMRDSARFTRDQWKMVEVVEGFVITTRPVQAHEELSCDYTQDFPDFGGAGTLDFLK